ncbi:uncharacterized protein B0H18DRAFT_1143605 [Fomitopsis serialis]|uniref:uncharacterized protein n=1 Tax=Fomitopsis serialis TaxID=139415 RepID=UPI002008B81C|nr:uncharacterized protein B0H18DRAFT_1143605 [Neoantrodia serialis]KAH9930919.1 hypothetical protein B0H18DRAFT_1143605 [Neoantrodia serialis]
MSFFGFSNPSATNKPFLDVPPAPSRKASERLMKPAARVEMDDFLSSEADDLELSFASTMSLNSPPRDTLDLAPESERDNHPDYAPMDISPAPPTRVDKQRPFMGRPRAMTSNARLFGRDMSNNSGGNGSVTSLQSVAKSTGTNGASKRLQRAALPFEWMATGGQDANVASEPQNIPSSPAASDAMDVDSSFVYVPSSSVPSDGPLSAVPTITAFDVNNNPLAVPTSAAPTISTFEDYFAQVRACDFDGFAAPGDTSPGTPVESPSLPSQEASFVFADARVGASRPPHTRAGGRHGVVARAVVPDGAQAEPHAQHPGAQKP